MFGKFNIIRTPKWRDLRIEVRSRLIEPMDDPVFVMYFFLIILVVGGLGIWLSIIRFFAEQSIQNTIAIPRTLSTYSLAIVAGAFVQLSFLSFPEATLDLPPDDSRSNSTMRALWMLALSVVVLAAILALAGLGTVRPAWAYPCSLVGTAFALFLWWIANYDNTNLRLPSPSAVTGGDLNKMEGHIENENISLK